MSGKPAARQGDMTQYGGSIVQGSAGVRIGAPTGVACSVCPGGVTSGHPVNPLLGAKVLPGETDLALPGYTEYGRDNGIRLSAVWLTHDPEYPENLPAAPLVRYGWTPRGELAVVYDRSGKQVRSFTYDDKYRGRMVAHRHTGRPEIRYRYDSDGRVTEQLNPAGLSYTYQYEKDRITITDSLNRREVLHTQGEAGLKRVVKKEHADGSVTQSQFDAVGRLKAQTDTAGRTTEYSPDVVTGLITRITTPDGRASAFYYNHHSQLTSATGPDGLEMRRKYDESGRLIQETAPDGDITRYRYDNPHSDLP
ncbi:hypothetical protein P2O59_21275, partial [Escherichia coli]